MEEKRPNKLQPTGEGVIPHAAGETDVAQIANQLHDRAAELADQIGKPDANPSTESKTPEPLPLDGQLNQVESLVAQTASEVGVAETEIAIPEPEPAVAKASKQTEVTKTPITREKPARKRFAIASLWKNAMTLGVLKVFAGCCSALDVVFRWVPVSIKTLIGYAALATAMTSVAVWVYVLVI